MHKGRVVCAEEIIEHMWDSETELFSNSFKVHISSLKKKLVFYLGEREVIKNIRGVGYFIAKLDD